jgi:hypothetical protein
MKEVKAADIPKIYEILDRNIKACKIEGRTSTAYCAANITLRMSTGQCGIWVDNIEKPQALLVVTVGKFGVMDENVCFVNTIYADGPRQDDLSLGQDMLDTVELYASNNSCDCIYGSAWVYKGCIDISPLWKRFGAEKQEIIYIKKLN